MSTPSDQLLCTLAATDVVVLHTLHFTMIYIVLGTVNRCCRRPEGATASRREKLISLLAYACMISFVWEAPAVYPTVVSPALRFLFGDFFDEYFWYRTRMDCWSSWLGVLFACVYPTILERRELLLDHRRWPFWAIGFVCTAMLAGWFAFWVATFSEPEAYLQWHRLIGCLPIPAYIFFRNVGPLSQYSLQPLEALGRVSLEAYLLQFHLLLSRQASEILYLVPNVSLPILNMIIVGALYIFGAQRCFFLTKGLRDALYSSKAEAVSVALTLGACVTASAAWMATQESIENGNATLSDSTPNIDAFVQRAYSTSSISSTACAQGMASSILETMVFSIIYASITGFGAFALWAAVARAHSHHRAAHHLAVRTHAASRSKSDSQQDLPHVDLQQIEEGSVAEVTEAEATVPEVATSKATAAPPPSEKATAGVLISGGTRIARLLPFRVLLPLGIFGAAVLVGQLPPAMPPPPPPVSPSSPAQPASAPPPLQPVRQNLAYEDPGSPAAGMWAGCPKAPNSTGIPPELRGLVNQHVVFVGDSVTHYQYIMLAAWIRTGRAQTRADTPSIAEPSAFDTWHGETGYYKLTNDVLGSPSLRGPTATGAYNPYESLDALRHNSLYPYVRLNRYFHHPDYCLRLTYIQSRGAHNPPLGAWGPTCNLVTPCPVAFPPLPVHRDADPVPEPTTWNAVAPDSWHYTVPDALTHHVAPLKPTLVVLGNEGLWSFRTDIHEMLASAAAAVGSSGKVLWRSIHSHRAGGGGHANDAAAQQAIATLQAAGHAQLAYFDAGVVTAPFKDALRSK
jgi:hypothetical protein